MKRFLGLALVGLLGSGIAAAALIDTRIDSTAGGASVDGVLGANEYGAGNSYNYRGAGSGFGGTLGAGTLYMESDASNLYIGFQPGANLNDNVFIMLDTRAGGFTDAQMADRGDGGRRAASEHSLNADDAYDAAFLPDFAIIIGSFGIVTFELTAGSTDGHLNFVDFDGTFTGSAPTFREYDLSLASLGISDASLLSINLFAGYTSDSSFSSNESIPAYDPLNSGANPGFDGPSAGYGNYNRFAVPEPASLALLLAGMLIRRR